MMVLNNQRFLDMPLNKERKEKQLWRKVQHYKRKISELQVD